MITAKKSPARSTEVRLYSEVYVPQTMPTALGAFDMTMLFVMIMFFINNPVSSIGAGAASILYWIIGALVFYIPCVVAATQLGTMFPHEGSTYNWTHKALGGFWSLFATVSFWVPGLLGMLGSASIAVSFLQGLNSHWLTAPWQQWLVLIIIFAFAAVLSLQRLQTVKYVINVTTLLTMGVVVLLGLAALWWLLSGHQAATSFNQASNWRIDASGFPFLGSVILAYLGADVSLNLGGELANRDIVKRHLGWGGTIVIIGYLVVTLALLVVLGPKHANDGPFAIITVVDQVFGRFMGDIAAICVIAFFPVFVTLMNIAFGRLLMATSIDRRFPIGLARLNRHRVPKNAIIFQTIVVMVAASIFYLLPYVIPLGDPATLSGTIFTVSLSSLTLVWAVSTAFMFIDLLVLYIRDRKGFLEKLIFPMPVLWLCIIVAPLSCVAAIVLTLSYSGIPSMDNDTWRAVVSGMTVICLIAAAIGSMFATSEAAWQDQVTEESS
ncbi:amino acid permease [Ktedonosporobacter rubrisoli]|uniref:Amino acid permease n=1 Tax=Ktedonosporobacter rubrisoli TaxID=2509675 RepID=A0A4P6JVF6_KTERU|nr:APC family permease [Ktedonosporobacter rubrisoli]QBD79649.1 amino acid permease [Ktedonosporobacter rubrisoli]